MKDTITGRHKGQTIVVAGTSPHVPDLPSDFLDNHIVIGVNNYPTQGDCNYLVIVDTHRIPDRMPHALNCLPKSAKTFFSRDSKTDDSPEPDHWFTRPRGTLGLNNWPKKNMPIPTVWNEPITKTGILQHVATVATAAANLALILGAKDIVLYRVDLIGDTINGNRVIPWSNFEPPVSYFFNKMPIPVYKTNPNSPLKLPMWSANEARSCV